MKINIRVYRMIVKILLAIVILVVAGVAVFLGMQISGRNKLYRNSVENRPNLSIEEQAKEVLSEKDNSDSYTWQEGDIRYQGTIYRYNEDILTFLFLGIDKMSEVKPVEDGIDGGQSDAIFLLVLNPHNKEVSIIGVPRDTMTEITVYNENGDYRGLATAQIALQHGYGDGAQLSCERSVQAVSKLFYQLPIHGYCALNMGAIPLINDAVGGVDLVAIEDVKGEDGFYVEKGQEIHLEGMDAYYYLKKRDWKKSGTAGKRLERQKQYLTAYASKVTKTLKTDITLPVTLYNTISKYMVTDITADEVSYLATQAVQYQFKRENMYSLTGEVVKGERFEEFYADEDALYEMILKVFYEEVDSESTQ